MSVPIESASEVFKNGYLSLNEKNSLYSGIYKPTEEKYEDEIRQIWIKPLGNTANRALSYLVAQKIKELSPKLNIRNYHLPEWGLEDFCEKPRKNKSCSLGKFRYWIDIHGLAENIERREIETLFQDAYCYNVDFLPSRERSKKILGSMLNSEKVNGFGNDKLVCNIRGGEILTGKYSPYIVMPPEYYRIISEDSQLDPVFFGQLEDNAYTEALQKMFPNSEFILGSSPEYDFETVRKSKNIAVAVSTFSWLAAWLSNAKKIYIPLGGMFHPNIQKHQNYITTDDDAYRYVLIPYCRAGKLYDDPKGFFSKLKMMADGIRLLGEKEVELIKIRSVGFWSKQPKLIGFDGNFYMSKYHEVPHLIEAGEYGSALEHYLHVGANKGYLPFDFEEEKFLIENPSASVSLALAEHSSPLSCMQGILQNKFATK